MTVAAVLLAAGGSTRFRDSARAAGMPVAHKLLAPLRGRTVFELALANVREARLDETIVVTGSVPLPVPADVTELHNDRWAEGQATSLALAVEHARARGHAAVVVGLADQPFLEAEAWRAVAAAPVADRIVTATYEGRRGAPVRIDAALWDLLPSSGDEGARVVMAGRPDLVVQVACEGSPVDIDTVEDLLRWS